MEQLDLFQDGAASTAAIPALWLPGIFPAATFEIHPETAQAYVVLWNRLLDVPAVGTLWYPLGISWAQVQRIFAHAGRPVSSLLGHRLIRKEIKGERQWCTGFIEPGLPYGTVFKLADGPDTKPERSENYVLPAPESQFPDADFWEWRAGYWYRQIGPNDWRLCG